MLRAHGLRCQTGLHPIQRSARRLKYLASGESDFDTFARLYPLKNKRARDAPPCRGADYGGRAALQPARSKRPSSACTWATRAFPARLRSSPGSESWS